MCVCTFEEVLTSSRVYGLTLVKKSSPTSGSVLECVVTLGLVVWGENVRLVVVPS